MCVCLCVNDKFNYRTRNDDDGRQQKKEIDSLAHLHSKEILHFAQSQSDKDIFIVDSSPKIISEQLNSSKFEWNRPDYFMTF